MRLRQFLDGESFLRLRDRSVADSLWFLGFWVPFPLICLFDSAALLLLGSISM